MTGRERFMTALAGKQPDRVPVWELIVNRPVIDALHGDVSYLDFCELEGLDAVTIFEDQRLAQLDEKRVVDEWGIVWGVDAPGIPYPVEGPIRSEADLEGYTPPDPKEEHRLGSLREAVARFKGEKAIVFLTHDGFEFPHNLRGIGELLIDYVLNPDLVHRLARIVVDYKAALLRRAVEAGADAIVSGDDYAYRTAPIMSPAHFETFVLPYLVEIVNVTHACGVPFIKHTDGYIWPILDAMIDAGIDAIDPIEPIAGMDIGEVKAKYRDRIAVIGNIDCTELLPRGTRDQVIDAVKETLAKASIGGGHILASSNSIHPAVHPENYRTMVETARTFGTYPLDEEMMREYRNRNYVERYTRGS